MDQSAAIGIFDSGVGGLTVAAALRQKMPQERFIYFGDTRHAPYGDKSKATIVDLSLRITRFLQAQECKAIVIACNSASAMAAEALQERFPALPIFNVIDPVVAAVVAQPDWHKVGVIATRATIRSKVYARRLQRQKPDLAVASVATPLLAAIVEEGFAQSDISRGAIREYLQNPLLADIDSLILGCTHYPLLQGEIEDFFGPRVRVLNSPHWVAEDLARQLALRGLASAASAGPDRFLVSEKTKAFQQVARLFFGESLSLEEKRL